MPGELVSLKLYRWVLKLYPATFRENYAELLEGEYRDELELESDLYQTLSLKPCRRNAEHGRRTLRIAVYSNRNATLGSTRVALRLGK